MEVSALSRLLNDLVLIRSRVGMQAHRFKESMLVRQFYFMHTQSTSPHVFRKSGAERMTRFVLQSNKICRVSCVNRKFQQGYPDLNRSPLTYVSDGMLTNIMLCSASNVMSMYNVLQVCSNDS